MRRIRRLLLAGSLLLASAPMSVAVQTAHAGTQQTYLVVYHQQALPAGAAATISRAGGTVVASYGAIGVAVVRSNSSTFRTSLMKDSRVEGVAATAAFATRLKDSTDAEVAPNTGIPASGDDPLSGLQWDMVQINAPAARAINGGSPSITVGDIDTGLDYTHPDLAPNVDYANSAGCVDGVPDNTPAAWMDNHGHGTHTAGTIAAARNDIGIVGVAPNVKIAGIKAGNADGFFFPEAVVCAFEWVATHNIQVTNNSYFADPWLFNCKNDAEQRAIWTAERRAIKHAQQHGAVIVAAAGNEADDLAHATHDVTSPDDTTPVSREITNACAVVPVEVPGVIGVSAEGDLEKKSFYSSYGVGAVQVVAPGGDSILQRTAASPNGRVLSDWPASLLTVTCLPARRVVAADGSTYCYQQGTSMASPHAVGVVALIMSTGITSPGAVAAKLNITAKAMPCPSTDVIAEYAFFPSVSNGAPQACQGGAGYNSWYGHGEVDALKAVSG